MSAAIPWSPPSLAPEIKAAVDAATSFTLAPVIDDQQAAAVRRALTTYERGLEGTPWSRFTALMLSIAVAFPSPRAMTEADATARLKLYYDHLRDIPADLLGEAVAHVIRTGTFFPKVGEIRKAAEEKLGERRGIAMRCRSLLMKHDRDWRRPAMPRRWTPADIAEANAAFRGLGIRTRYRLTGAELDNCESFEATDEDLETERAADPERESVA